MLLGPDVQDMDKHSTVDYAGYHLKADGYIPRGSLISILKGTAEA